MNYSEMTAAQIFDDIHRRDKDRAESMPDVQSALNQMFEAFLRLKDLGWREAMYCPKDGSMFDAISAGSTGICKTSYDGEWPKGRYWCYEAGDVWPSSPILFKPKESKNEKHK